MSSLAVPSRPALVLVGAPRRTNRLATEVDVATVEEAVGVINGMHCLSAMETAVAIGAYILRTFFGGDLAAFRGGRRGGGSHLSFRALARHRHLLVSQSYLWTAVALQEHVDRFPPSLIERIPLSWHRALFSVPDVADRIAVTEFVVDRGLGLKELKAAVRGRRGSPARTGRPPTPALDRLRAAVMARTLELERADVTVDLLRRLPRRELAALRASIDALEEDLDDVVDRIDEAAGAP